MKKLTNKFLYSWALDCYEVIVGLRKRLTELERENEMLVDDLLKIKNREIGYKKSIEELKSQMIVQSRMTH
jgi:hypothetical protein